MTSDDQKFDKYYDLKNTFMGFTYNIVANGY